MDFPGVSDNPPSVSGVIITESTYEFRGRSAVRLSVSFDFPDVYPWFSHVGVYVAIVGYSDDDPIDDDYVTTKLVEDAVTDAGAFAAITATDNFIRSDNSAAAHTRTTVDRFNGFKVNGLDTLATTLEK